MNSLILIINTLLCGSTIFGSEIAGYKRDREQRAFFPKSVLLHNPKVPRVPAEAVEDYCNQMRLMGQGQDRIFFSDLISSIRLETDFKNPALKEVTARYISTLFSLAYKNSLPLELARGLMESERLYLGYIMYGKIKYTILRKWQRVWNEIKQELSGGLVLRVKGR